jgi:hypothetical protein
MSLFTLPHFSDPKVAAAHAGLCHSPDVRSQDALGLISSVMSNPAGEKLAWDFVLAHWDAVQKAGGVFASAEVVRATDSFCDAICAIRSLTFSPRTRSKRRSELTASRLSASTTASI